MNAAAGMLRAGLFALAVAAAALVSGIWPLVVWAGTLAVFGVPHALVELRWVGHRYARWRSLLVPVAGMLAAIAAVRLGTCLLGLRAPTSAAAEVLLGMLLAAIVLPRDWRRCPVRGVVGLLVVAALGAGIAVAPIDTMLVLAILHNIAPVGLIADRLGDADITPAGRRRWLAAMVIGFAVVPVWLATGAAADQLALAATRTTPGDAAAAAWFDLDLGDGLAAFVPSWISEGHALDLLRAAAFLQCMHYVAVLAILPRLGPVPDRVPRPAVPPRRARSFAVVVAGLGLVFAIAFGIDFRESRAAYGVLAAVHVWVELPALLLALTPPPLRPAS